MKERIKCIRKKAGLTQTQFGELIGVKGNTITNYETGLRTPTDAVIKSICREFHINEEWLRTGKGEMSTPLSRNQQITDFLGDLIKEDDGVFKKRLIEAMSKLDKRDWEDIERLVNKLTKKDQAEA